MKSTNYQVSKKIEYKLDLKMINKSFGNGKSKEKLYNEHLSPVYGNPYRLNSFELFLTKFICGWLIGNFPESQKHKDFYYSTIDDTIENNNHDVQIFVNYEFMDEPHRIEKNNTDNNWELKMVTTQPSPSPLSSYLNDQVSVEWEDLLKVELKARLEEIESKIQDKIVNWRQGKAKIECAGFCDLLYDKSYFNNKNTRVKTCNQFALSRYGCEIIIQLKSVSNKRFDTIPQSV